MGGCVISIMRWRNSISTKDSECYSERITYGPINKKVTPDEPDRSGIYRYARVTDKEHKFFSTNFYDGENILQSLERNCKERDTQNAIFYRKIKKMTKEKKIDAKGKERVWEYTHLDEPTKISYNELWKLILAFGRGLVELGIKKMSKVAIYEETRWEWLTSMFGLWTQEMIGVTVYSNLGSDALHYALKETVCAAIVCNGKNIDKLVKILDDGVPMKTIIYLDELSGTVDLGNYQVYAWMDVVQKGMKSTLPYTIPHNNETSVLIMYTSGTVGNPKGVEHSIGSLTHGVHIINDRLSELVGEETGDSYIAYLPSAHIFEFVCENIMLLRGAKLCFGSPRTLTDTYARPCGDISLYRPFMMIGVPRVFETLKKTVEELLPRPGTLKRRIFDTAYQSRLEALKKGKDTPYWNKVVFKTARALWGGRMRGICCGGAPIADKTQEWLNVVLGVPVVQGYGMTETVCNATVQRFGEFVCVAGQLLKGLEARLLDVEEYKHTDTPNPRGELLLHGNFLFKSYYKQPELTKEVLLPNGWLRTGDIAEFDAKDGNMRLIGRIKGLAKNILGEYIALESLEALYCQHPIAIANGVCILVDAQKPYICALALTDETKAIEFAKTHKIPGSWPDILKNTKFQEEVTTSMVDLAKREGKMGFEHVRRVRILVDEWTPENGLTTASSKIRRPAIEKHYADVIQELFSD
ncbi:unnamed protein product [Phytomonas sp. Hart1]|nr:unnamed protein product [Phytomonas sp. Hart1]|eukprot:CCW71313.1 unnamed protein product [Phytomonas sp. isolate Hart1]